LALKSLKKLRNERSSLPPPESTAAVALFTYSTTAAGLSIKAVVGK